MRNRTLFFTIIFLFILCITVYAHPGRTDSNGGHYNRDTGEYHYHNGEHAGKNQDNDTYTYSYSEFVGPTFSYDYGSNSYNSFTVEETTTNNSYNSNSETISNFLEILFGVFGCLIASLGITAIILSFFGRLFPEKAFWKISVALLLVILIVSLFVTFK